jgi:flagellar motor protein MotB
MMARRSPVGGQVRHADDWLMTYADTITLLLCLFAVLLALHGAKLHDAGPAATAPSAGALASFTLPQAPVVVAPFGDLAGMPRPVSVSLADADDDADDRTPPPNSPLTRRALPVTGPSAADAVIVVSFATEASATPDPVPLTPPVANAAPIALAISPVALPARPADMTQRAADVGRAATPPPMTATPVSATATAAPEQQGDRITIFQLSSAAFFASGTATLSDTGQTILGSLLGRLQSPAFAAYRITVEGHTDDAPISSAQFPSNWELSAARAAAVVRFFVEHGVPADRLRAAGYADTRPLVPNRDGAGNPIPENQAKNRRVAIELEKIEHGGT